MKRDGINQLSHGLGIVIIAALFYLSKRNQFITNKFLLVIIKSFHFNSMPVISISVMAIGEYLLWETQNNTDVIAVKNKATKRFNLILFRIQLGLINLLKRNLITFKELKFNSMSFKL